jgi:hypothetical protein
VAPGSIPTQYITTFFILFYFILYSRSPLHYYTLVHPRIQFTIIILNDTMFIFLFRTLIKIVITIAQCVSSALRVPMYFCFGEQMVSKKKLKMKNENLKN